MATTIHTRHSFTRREGLPASILGLAVLLSLLFVGAFQGGLAMVVDPLQPLGMSIDLLEGTPIGTFFWPGVCLLAIAVASLLAVVGLLLRWPWRWALPIERLAGFRWPWIATVLTATVVLALEILELSLIPFHPLMHPLLLAGSAGILALASLPVARHHFRVHP